MVRNPAVYAALLGEKIRKHNVKCWLVNTGWIGGPYGVGQRIPIQYTRTLLNSALEGKLDDVPMVTDPFFGLTYPVECPDVPRKVLTPRDSWESRGEYDAKASELAKLFRANFRSFEKARRRCHIEGRSSFNHREESPLECLS